MSANGYLQLAFYLAVLLLLAKPFGSYMARIYQGEPAVLNRWGAPVERLVYRLCAIDPAEEMHWTQYALAVLWFSLAGFAAVYALARAMQAGGGLVALVRVAAGGALGAMLSAFFWLPALAERYALSPERTQRVIGGPYTYFLHFVDPRQWLDPGWGFGSSVTGPADGMSFC